MKRSRVAVVGYGNIGRYVIEALESSPDFEIAGIVRREIPKEPSTYPIVKNIKDLENIQTAILCVPSRSIKEYAKEILSLGINTVDSFDIHSEIVGLRNELDKAAKEGKSTAIVAAGWDPGTDSVIRALLLACAPKGLTYTNFGPGMSMGHTVAVKSLEGVKNALSMTIPLGTGIHRRMVYIEVKEGYLFEEISKKIKSDSYFVNDETHVFQVDSVDQLQDMGHGVNMTRKGVSGKTQNQTFEFNMKINNPALTAQVLVSSARAGLKQKPGAYTLIEIAPIDMLSGNKDELIRKLV